MLFTAIVIGFAGSLHCLGMCSPLAIAVTGMQKPYMKNRIVYNVGRIFTYALLGALVSSFGSLFQFSGFQNLLSIVLGSVLIVLGLTGMSSIRIPFLTHAMQHITIRIKSLFSKFIQRKTILSIAFMGMLNGLLPCGLTYVALTYCLALPNAMNGFFFMLIFGAGTLPVMLGLTSVVQTLISRFNISFRKLTTVVMISLGALLITRSLFIHDHGKSNVTEGDNIVICR